MSAEIRPSYADGATDWCVHGTHLACPVVISTANGRRECGCPCHNTEDAA